jgi:AcrR family transcriptional regulator
VARSSWISDLHWVRTAKQPRGQRTVSRLLDAAEELISQKGIEDTTVADVAARAGCSVGAFYHHFRDKGALLRVLLDRLGREFRETMRAAVDPRRWQGATIAEILEAYLQFSIEMGRERAGLHRAQLLLSLRDAAFGEESFELQRELGARLRELLLARREEVGHREPPLAIDFVLEQLRSMLMMRLDGALLRAGLETTSDADFVREAIASVCAYMQIPSPPTAECLP